ncbi:MAG: SRPBCC domain-containing protein [Actinomycetota bacterium]
MPPVTHVYEIYIHAPQARVWEALLAEADTTQYFHRTRFESTFEPGAPLINRLATSGTPAAEGTVEIFDPPHRLAYTWRFLYDDELAAEPAGRVEWTLAPANDDGTVTRVTLRHGDLGQSPKTWHHVRLGWVGIINALKTWLETGEPLPPVATDDHRTGDNPDPAVVAGRWHRAEAIATNGAAWELLDGRTPTADEADQLLELAYASAHHWRRATGTTAVNRARSSWLLSRAHVTLGQGDLALHHAQRCAAHTDAAGAEAADFDRAYAAEARARSLACLGRVDEARTARAEAEAVVIGDAEDRAITTRDLTAGPWFGLDRS